MKNTGQIITQVTPANDFDAAAFIGPRQPKLTLVEKEEGAPVAVEEDLVTIGNFTLNPIASRQYRIQKAMLDEALAKAARYATPAPSAQPRDLTWRMMPMQQQKGGLLFPKN